MTFDAQRFAPRPPSKTNRRGVQHPWLMAVGITDLVLTHLAAIGYAFFGIAVGTCSGADGSGTCASLSLRYNLAGCALALNAVVGVVTVVLARPAGRPVTCRALVAALVVSVTVTAVAGVALLSSGSGTS